MLQKITSINGFVFLFVDIPHTQRNNASIASGESVLLSIYENDSYYFTTDINLIGYDSITKTEEPTELEKNFFELLRVEKELKYKRALVDEYEIAKFVHYLPKIKYTQSLQENKIFIRGDINYPENIYEREAPTILLDDEVIPLINESYFEYVLDANLGLEKVNFKLDLPKQTVTSACKIKNLKKD